jgi:glycine/D-amino acid oxidase-like deaminating enzyme
LQVEDVDRIEGLWWPDTMRAVYERRAGLLAVEDCVRAHVALSGADVRVSVVDSWATGATGVAVLTHDGVLSAERLVLTPGAWLGRDWPVTVLRKAMFWYASAVHDRVPAFYFELPEGHFYGFPRVDGDGVKVAEHTGGREVVNPSGLGRDVDPVERRRAAAFLGRHVPGASDTLVRHEACMYTMTEDGHFLVGRHPHEERVVLAAGLCGHGFKFTSVLGEILADLVLDGTTRHPIGFLDPGRFRDWPRRRPPRPPVPEPSP